MVRGTLLLVVVGALRTASAPGAPALVAESEGDDLPELLSETREAVDEARRRGTALGEGERLDPNRATEVELDRLPGVGPATALAIVESRDREGGFRAAEDLLRVRGIGPGTLDRIRPHLDFGAGVPAALRGRRGGVQRPVDSTVPLNSATAEQLQSIPGIGPALSTRILALRSDRGRFRSLDELLDVPGIGLATLEKIRGRLSLRP